MIRHGYAMMMGDGRWEMEDGRWKMEDGRWKMEDGRWKMGKRRRLVAVLDTNKATRNLQPATQN
jgi:hypothetical protein